MSIDSMNLEQLTDEEFELLEKKVKNERIRRDKEKYEEDRIIRTKYEGKLYNLYILLKKHKKFKENSEENLFNNETLDNLFNSLINAMYNHHAKVRVDYNRGYSGSIDFHNNKEIRDILDKLEENLKTNVLDALTKQLTNNSPVSSAKLSAKPPANKPDDKPRPKGLFSRLRFGGSNKKYKRSKTKSKRNN
jgi:hypothetical protein